MRPVFLPEEIVVGPQRYKINARGPEDARRELEEGGSVGLCDADLARIWISPDIAAQRVPVIVLHELIHACADVADLGDDETEEDWAARLAPVLLEVLRRNPALVSYLTAEV